MAVAAGADALGLVLHADSRRRVDLDQAEAIIDGLPPLVSLVGLFVDAPAGFVEVACDRLQLDLLQFHGQESAADCNAYGRRWIKAVAVAPDTDIALAMAAYTGAAAILLDTYLPGGAGGSGQSFDWSQVPVQLPLPVVLAGGLNAVNVGEAIRQVRPFAVDVSSGVESGPGLKDPAEISRFIDAVRAVDHEIALLDNGKGK
jgi:phosphoribosylanthranilate isomerase